MADVEKILGKNAADLSKVLGIDVSTVAKLYGLDWPATKVPAGVIGMYRSAGGAPSGWTAFTSANGKFIKGAYSSLAVGTTGGSNSLGITLSGSGTHGTNTATTRGGGTGAAPDYNPLVTGNHSHTATASLYPPDRYGQLMKLNADADQIPGYITPFAHQTLSGLTQYFNGEYRLFKASTGYSYSGSWTPANVYTTYAGSHHHVGNTGDKYTDVYASNNCNVLIAAGNHRHLLTMSACTNNIYRTRLTAWSSNSTFDLQEGMIFMYESITPPDGWALCDGNNGTPDLRNRLAEFGTTSNHGTTYGNGTVTANWSEGNHGTHRHYLAQQYNTSTNFPHCTYQAHANGHSSSQAITFSPPWYALAFIMYLG